MTIHVELEVAELRALLPQSSRGLTVEGWNRRAELADGAHRKLRAALEAAAGDEEEQVKGVQGSLVDAD